MDSLNQKSPFYFDSGTTKTIFQKELFDTLLLTLNSSLKLHSSEKQCFVSPQDGNLNDIFNSFPIITFIFKEAEY